MLESLLGFGELLVICSGTSKRLFRVSAQSKYSAGFVSGDRSMYDGKAFCI